MARAHFNDSFWIRMGAKATMVLFACAIAWASWVTIQLNKIGDRTTRLEAILDYQGKIIRLTDGLPTSEMILTALDSDEPKETNDE